MNDQKDLRVWLNEFYFDQSFKLKTSRESIMMWEYYITPAQRPLEQVGLLSFPWGMKKNDYKQNNFKQKMIALFPSEPPRYLVYPEKKFQRKKS